MSRPRHLSRLMVSPSVHVVYLFNHHRLPLRVLLRAGSDSASLLSTSSKDAPSGTTILRNTPGSANSVSSGQDPDPLPHSVRTHTEQPRNFRFSTNNRRFYVSIIGGLNEA